MKKFITILLVIASLLTMMVPLTVGAAETPKTGELVLNGDFEQGITGWTNRGGTFKEIQDDVHGGKKAVSLSHTENMYIRRNIYPISGETYKLSFWAKLGKNDTGNGAQAAYKLEGYNAENENTFNKTETVELTENWKQYTFTVKMGEVERVSFLLRMFKGGEVYFDDVSIRGKFLPSKQKAEEEPATAPAKPQDAVVVEEILPSVDGVEYLKNGDFEEGNEKPAYWEPMGGTWTEKVTYDKTTAHSGNASLKISTEDGGNPWARCAMITDVEPGATYQATAWYNAKTASPAVVMKVEFYLEPEISADTGCGQGTSQERGDTGGQWKQMVYGIKPPDKCKAFVVYLRFLSATGAGTVWFDDVSVKKVKSTNSIAEIVTDEVFYYTGTKTGATLITLRDSALSYQNGSVNFRITSENGTVVEEKKDVKFYGRRYAKFTFSPDSLALRDPYTVTAEIIDAGGNVVGSETTQIYRYDRPSCMDENGIYYDQKTGKPFYPTIAYHAKTDFASLQEIGINVIQGSNYDLETYLKLLDEADKYGMKILITLYPGMKPAGSAENEAHTRQIVEGIKHHNAVFAYAVQDEPWGFSADPTADLIKSYKLIRDMDPVHPIYLVENMENHYNGSGKLVDILCADAYPKTVETAGTEVANRITLARETMHPEKHLCALGSVFTFHGFRPEAHEARNQIYQMEFNGATWGFYPWYPDNPQIDKVLPESIYWDDLKSYYEKEYALFRDYFYLGLYPTFSRGDEGQAHWDSFVKDGSVYMAVYNDKRAPFTVNIPLVSDKGQIALGDAMVEVVNGADTMNAVVEGNALRINLTETQAVLYKLTPAASVDWAGLSGTRFTDTAQYTWAADAIKILEDKEIANGKATYRPGEAITRGDFAMFLVRTLGLNENMLLYNRDTFADVDDKAEYAKWLHIGKVHGLINGVGDNKYMPEAQITRQDLMTIIARGLNLTEKADLSVYSDKDLIADYAADSVAAMVKAGLIQGNADGTLNPLGNATRAEAAVIMQRIMEKYM